MPSIPPGEVRKMAMNEREIRVRVNQLAMCAEALGWDTVVKRVVEGIDEMSPQRRAVVLSRHRTREMYEEHKERERLDRAGGHDLW
jgi:hypothetical protein